MSMTGRKEESLAEKRGGNPPRQNLDPPSKRRGKKAARRGGGIFGSDKMAAKRKKLPYSRLLGMAGSRTGSFTRKKSSENPQRSLEGKRGVSGGIKYGRH